VHTAELEPFGLVVIEAMARGVPVVAPLSGGPREAVRDGVDGVLVDVDDPAALARSIVDLLADPARRTRIGAAGRERALSAFGEDRMVAEAWALAGRVALGARIGGGAGGAVAARPREAG
jgi:type III pantothenate kinase